MKKCNSCFLICIQVFSLFFVSCQSQKSELSEKHLSVSLVETPILLKNLFSNVRVISLETSEDCFIKRIDKVICFDNSFYVLDSTLPAVYVFDQEGAFLHNIGKKGDGPGEYTLIYDFLVDRENEIVELLSPFGSIYSYQLDGQFIERKILPDHVPNYHKMAYLNSDLLVTKSGALHDENSLSLISRASLELMNGFWKKHFMLNMFTGNAFYEYNGSVFFSSGIHNEVYEVKEDGLSLAYIWDFGSMTTDIEKYKFSEDYAKDFNNEYRDFLQEINDKKYPYWLSDQNQNERYIYTELRRGVGERIHLFYDKASREYKLFDKTIEGVILNPLAFTDDYVLGVLSYSNKESYLSTGIVDEKSIQFINSYSEDDNPLLAFYEFVN